MLDQSAETIYAGNGNGTEGLSTDDINESDADNNLESNLRRRKGKIISCAKETIENGKWNFRIIFFLLNMENIKRKNKNILFAQIVCSPASKKHHNLFGKR